MHASIVGLEKSRKIAAQLTNRAFAALKIFKGKAGSVGSARGVSVEAGSLTKLSNAFVITCYRTSMQNVPFKLLDVWALLEGKPDEGLVAGQVGAVAELLPPGVFEVEFLDSQGRTVALAELPRAELLF